MSHLNGSAGWLASALAAAEKAFTLLTTPPGPLVFDTRTIGHGLPAGMVPLDELRTLLLDPATCDAARDGCWHLLVDHARRWGPAWVVAAVGMALAALVRIAGKPAHVASAEQRAAGRPWLAAPGRPADRARPDGDRHGVDRPVQGGLIRTMDSRRRPDDHLEPRTRARQRRGEAANQVG